MAFSLEVYLERKGPEIYTYQIRFSSESLLATIQLKDKKPNLFILNNNGIHFKDDLHIQIQRQ